MVAPLTAHADCITANLTGLLSAMPELAQAAETVHQSLSSLLYEDTEIPEDNFALNTARTMGFGAHSSWVMAFILTASGHGDSGLSITRRAIEFTCYAGKVHDREELATDWMRHREDEGARRRFGGSTRIPDAYGRARYRCLRSLLVYYDLASFYGAHANLETIARNLRGEEEGNLGFSFQVPQEDVPVNAGTCLLVGYRVLTALREFLDSGVTRADRLDPQIEATRTAIRAAREAHAEVHYDGAVPRDVAIAIATDDQAETDRLFEEMMAEGRERQARRNEGGA